MYVLLTCTYTQKLKMCQMFCKITREIGRIEIFLQVNACFKTFLASTRVFHTFVFDWDGSSQSGIDPNFIFDSAASITYKINMIFLLVIVVI